MPAFEHVVVGFDGSAPSVHALRWAQDRVAPGKLVVVHCGPSDPTVPDGIDAGSVLHCDEGAEDALLARAHEVGADTIVIGPHGSGLGLGLGRVARHLLRHSTLPVVIVDGAEPPRSPDRRPPVVACVGQADTAEVASRWAADYAQARQLPLVLLHAVAYRPIFPLDSASDVLASYLGAGVSAEWAMSELEQLASELGATHPEIEITSHVDTDSLVKAVERAGQNAELVVLGKRSDEAFLDIIGTPRLRRLVARSRFPTAVIPTP